MPGTWDETEKADLRVLLSRAVNMGRNSIRAEFENGPNGPGQILPAEVITRLMPDLLSCLKEPEKPKRHPYDTPELRKSLILAALVSPVPTTMDGIGVCMSFILADD